MDAMRIDAMAGRPRVPPLASRHSDLPVVEGTWRALWRAVWADLPLAWSGETDRFLFRWVPPVGEAPTGGHRGVLD